MRRGRSAAFLKRLRKKHGLGEYARRKSRRGRSSRRSRKVGTRSGRRKITSSWPRLSLIPGSLGSLSRGMLTRDLYFRSGGLRTQASTAKVKPRTYQPYPNQ